MSYRAAGARTTIKRGLDSRSSVRYAAACLRRERDPQVSYMPISEDDDTWSVLKIDRRWNR